MKLRDRFHSIAAVAAGVLARVGLAEEVRVGRAVGRIQHIRNGVVIWEEEVRNVKTKAGIDFTFGQAYNSAGTAQATGLSYIGLSNDAVTEDADSTTLSNEIAANGLSRAAGTYAHTPGAATATIAHTFTCTTAPQAAQKAALFSAASSGAMHHVLAFTQRSLQVDDQLTITFTITLS